MRPRSIRNQILVPIVTIQVAAVLAASIGSAWLAAGRVEREVVDRLNALAATLGQANFPMTTGVLAKMKGLTGAHFVVLRDDGRVAESTVPGLSALPEGSRPKSATKPLAGLDDAPTLDLSGVRYVVLPLRPGSGGPADSLLVLYPETRWRRERREAAIPALIVGSVALGLLVAVTAWVAHRISKRLGEVRRQVARIASGDFLELDPGSAGDEVDDLARSINHMSSELRRMSRSIRRSERSGLLAQLGAGLAHQLRNSITGAKMSIQLHLRRFPDRRDESLDVALRQLTMTEEQVKGLLSLGRVEDRPPEDCDLGDLLREVALLIGPSCRHSGIALKLSPPCDTLTVTADPASLKAAILNLSLNAVEAAGPGGEVEVAATVENGEAIVEIRDDGPGPPPDLADSLFEPFVSGKPEGVGLGLALAHRVAIDCGGRLAWDRVGDGTIFRLVLPISSRVMARAGA